MGSGQVTLPGGERSKTFYDENLRVTSVVIAYGTSDAATTSFAYDNVGNVTSQKAPKQQTGLPYDGQSTTTVYDERNRIASITDPIGNQATFKYDAAGRKKNVTRPNGQVITYDNYNSMNRVLQQTVTQTPSPDAVTKYEYDTTGQDLFYKMQDPRLSALNSPQRYVFNFDQLGRKTSVNYPPAVDGGPVKSESWTYDTVDRLSTFTNRDGTTQTVSYDALHRPTSITWSNHPVTPNVTLGYDVGSRLTSINNANATIAREYLNDNRLKKETTTYADSVARAVEYSYNANGGCATLKYPANAYSFTYNYTARQQPWKIINNSGGATQLTNLYDLNGNLTNRTPNNATATSYSYDGLNRVTSMSHQLNGTARTFQYDYDSVSNRKWTKRDNASGDVFGYDLNDQATTVLLDIANPESTSPSSPTITYDANGNRISFGPYGYSDTYATNNLNQYTGRNSSQASYDLNGNLTTSFDGSTHTFDAQNRLLTATRGGTTESYAYDGLNRQVSRTINGGAATYNVYDGWRLLGEYAPGATTPSNAYLAANTGILMNLVTGNYYYQDGTGSTSHLANGSGQLLESYRYDLEGKPMFFDASNSLVSSSAYSIRHLFTGQQWYSSVNLYDLRNRFYSTDLGRFIQADPAGFAGDASNLYRYCGNNPTNNSDPLGLWTFQIGVGISGNLGPLALNDTIGIAFDGQGNLALFGTFFGGAGVGGRASVGVSLAASNAGTVNQLRGPFYQASAGGGLGPNGSAQGFWDDNGVVGGGITIGAGAGGGGSAGISGTTIVPLNYPAGDALPQANIDDICPECATVEEVSVIGEEVSGGAGAAPSVPSAPGYYPHGSIYQIDFNSPASLAQNGLATSLMSAGAAGAFANPMSAPVLTSQLTGEGAGERLRVRPILDIARYYRRNKGAAISGIAPNRSLAPLSNQYLPTNIGASIVGHGSGSLLPDAR